MKRWIVLFAFPYAVSVVQKGGNCIRYAAADPTICVQFGESKQVYTVDGFEVGDNRALAHDLANALNKAHIDREASETKDLPSSDEPKINNLPDDQTLPSPASDYGAGKNPS